MELESHIERASTYKEALDDCLSESHKFFLEVKRIVKSLAGPSFNNYSDFYEKRTLASIGSRFNNYQSRIEVLENKVVELENIINNLSRQSNE